MSGSGPPVDIEEIRKTCPVFRVLIIGRANAGKTTILQKVCNVGKGTKPVVYDADGNRLKDWDAKSKFGSKLLKIRNRLRPSSWMRKKHALRPTDSESSHQTESSDSEMSDTDILRPSAQRGRHDIGNQITYPGSRFIFHDSRGIESGSVDEFEIIHKFVHERASKQSLAEHLHVIWFCVPMDNKRPLVDAELSFFNKNPENVPVIVVFTKYDALLDQVANDLGILDLTEHNKAAIDKEAEARYQEHYISRIMKTAYAPKAVVRLHEMNKAETNCPELSERTAAAIDDLSLRQLFVSVQQNNLNLCMQEAASISRQQWANNEFKLIKTMWTLFPHAWNYGTEMSKPEEWREHAEYLRENLDAAYLWDDLWDVDDDDIQELNKMYEHAMEKSSVKVQLAAAAVMIGADSFSMWKRRDNPWKQSLEHFKSAHKVQKLIQDMVNEQFDETASEEAQAQAILQIANSALELLNAEHDKALSHEEEAHH